MNLVLPSSKAFKNCPLQLIPFVQSLRQTPDVCNRCICAALVEITVSGTYPLNAHFLFPKWYSLETRNTVWTLLFWSVQGIVSDSSKVTQRMADLRLG